MSGGCDGWNAAVSTYNTVIYCSLGASLLNIVFIRCVMTSKDAGRLRCAAYGQMMFATVKLAICVLLFTILKPDCSAYPDCPCIDVSNIYPIVLAILVVMWFTRARWLLTLADAVETRAARQPFVGGSSMQQQV